MARTSSKPNDLSSIQAQKDRLLAQIAELDVQAKEVEAVERDAGRPTLLAALDRVKIRKLGKADARLIANAIASFGGSAVAAHLGSLGKE